MLCSKESIDEEWWRDRTDERKKKLAVMKVKWSEVNSK